MASAFAVASKGAPLAGLLRKLLVAAAPPASGSTPAALALRPASVAASRRLFSTRGAPFRRHDDVDDYFEEESSSDEDVFYDVRCRRARELSFSADVVDPFGKPVKLGRLLALMEEEDDDDDAAAPRRGWWVSKEDGDAVQLKVAMPGIAKEHVKVWADKDGSLMIKGEGTEDDDEEEGPARYCRHIELSSDAFKMDQIKAEMKDGVLKVTLPKIKIEERKDVFQVKVE